MTDNINPDHYKLANGHEVIEVSENLTSNGGQAVQYIARATRTDGVVKGDPVEDLRKAVWFIEREIARLSGDYSLGRFLELRGFVDLDVPPRVWQSFDDIPADVAVTDADGGPWSPSEIEGLKKDRTDGKPYGDRWAPFTEVKEPND